MDFNGFPLFTSPFPFEGRFIKGVAFANVFRPPKRLKVGVVVVPIVAADGFRLHKEIRPQR